MTQLHDAYCRCCDGICYPQCGCSADICDVCLRCSPDHCECDEPAGARVDDIKRKHLKELAVIDMSVTLGFDKPRPFKPWSAEQFEHAIQSEKRFGYVVKFHRTLAGYAIVRLKPGRWCIDRLAIRPALQRRKLGTHLVRRLIALASKIPNARAAIETHITERNLPAQLFFRSLRFEWVSTWKPPRRLAESGWQDVYQMVHLFATEETSTRPMEPVNRIENLLR